MIKIGINGFGRIGRLVFRAAICADDIEVVAVNAPDKTPEQLAYTVKYDSVHGRFHGTVDCEGGENPALIVNGKRVALLNNRDAKLLPWGELGVEYVLECTCSIPPVISATHNTQRNFLQLHSITIPPKAQPHSYRCGRRRWLFATNLRIFARKSLCLLTVSAILFFNTS